LCQKFVDGRIPVRSKRSGLSDPISRKQHRMAFQALDVPYRALTYNKRSQRIHYRPPGYQHSNWEYQCRRIWTWEMYPDDINFSENIGMLRSGTILTIGDCNNFPKSLPWIRMENITSDRDACEDRRNTRNNSRYPHNRGEFEHQ
jgi:hypothetical protein